MNHRLSFIILFVVVILTGCAKHEYVITQPSEFAGRLTKQERDIAREPVLYHLVDQSSRVGIRIENTTDQPITLKGNDSYVVTPWGESQPMRGVTIAPHTWSAFTIPPLERRYYGGSGMSFGLGIGTWGGNTATGVGVGYSPYDDVPYASDVVAWQWKDGAVQVHVVLEPKDDPAGRAEHDFTIERRKVE
jgi:hypothetical protein